MRHPAEGSLAIARPAVLLTGLALFLSVAAATAQLTVGPQDVRLTEWGPPAATDRNADSPAIAWNSTEGLFLVAWSAPAPAGPADGNREIFAALLDPASVTFVSDIVQVSDVGPAGEALRDAWSPAVAWNAFTNSYLVVWSADDGSFGLADNQAEIFGRRLSRAGGIWSLSAIGPISDSAGASGQTTRDGNIPRVAWGSADHDWLVVWQSDSFDAGLADNETEIFAQRISSDFELLDSPVRISSMGPAGTSGIAWNPAVIYHPGSNRFLISWSGDDVGPGWIDQRREIFVRAVFATTGDAIGPQTRLSQSGPTDQSGPQAIHPSMTWNRFRDRILVVWSADIDDPILAENEFEIWGTEIDSNLNQFPPGQFRISEMGTDGDPLASAFTPAAIWEERGDQYIVAWNGWHGAIAPTAPEAPLGGPSEVDEEIWGRALLRGAGGLFATDQIAISDMGGAGPDTELYDARSPALVLGAGSRALVVWSADDSEDGMVDGEFEIFGETIVGPAIFIEDFEAGNLFRWSLTIP